MSFLPLLLLLLLSSAPPSTAKRARGGGGGGAPPECSDVYPHALDTGLYLAQPVPDAGAGPPVAWRKICSSPAPPPSPAPSPATKRSAPDCSDWLVFVHGAQPEIVRSRAPRTHEDPEFVQLVAGWLAAGWRVAVFEWPQLADEPLASFERAEAKIWSTRFYNRMQYTYRRSNGSVGVGEASILYSATDLFVAAYNDLFGGNRSDVAGSPAQCPGREVRLAGHSLGSQLVVHAAFQLQRGGGAGGAPGRVALLDPVYSPFRQVYLTGHACGATLAAVLGCEIDALTAGGTAVEIYRSSLINRCVKSAEHGSLSQQDAAYEHLKFTAWGELSDGSCYSDHLWSHPKDLPRNIGALANQIYHQHAAVITYYFLSLTRVPLRCILAGSPSPTPTAEPRARARRRTDPPPRSCAPTSTPALSAGMSTVQVLAWRNVTDAAGNRLCFHQYDDADRGPAASTVTIDPADDLFYIAPCH